MTFWVAGAIVVGSVATGVSASRSAKSAAKRAERSAAAGRDQVDAAGALARDDVMDFFPAAQDDLLAGAGAAGDLITSGTREQQRLLAGGNVRAQKTLGSTFEQQKNALLGLPVDQQAFQSKGLPLSPPMENPLANNGPGQGLFTGIDQAPVLADQKRLKNSFNNSDVLGKVLDGEIELPGVDLDFLDSVLQTNLDRPFGASDSLFRIASQNDPAVIDRWIEFSGLPEHKQPKFRQLLAGLSSVINAGGGNQSNSVAPRSEISRPDRERSINRGLAASLRL